MNKIVAFHALPRAGKTTAAEPLIARGFFKAAFGDGIYHELAIAFGVKVEELRSHEWKTTPINLLSNRSSNNYKYRAMLESMGEDMAVPRTSRYHLQRWATEYRRRQDPMYWVKQVDQKLKYVNGNIVIDDLRFVDTEYPYLRHLAASTNREFVVVEVIREGNPYGTTHSSDAHLPYHLIDHVLHNIEGHPEALQHELINLLYPTEIDQ